MKIASRPTARPPLRILSGFAALTVIAFAPAVPVAAEQKSPNRIDEPHPIPTETQEHDEDRGRFYISCSHARREGSTPLLRGQRGYSQRLDSDGDGRACEAGEY